SMASSTAQPSTSRAQPRITACAAWRSAFPWACGPSLICNSPRHISPTACNNRATCRTEPPGQCFRPPCHCSTPSAPTAVAAWAKRRSACMCRNQEPEFMHATFEILLEQPLIISQQAASAGAHQSLDYIPGSVLLGLAASRLYANLPAQTAFTLFHNGIVRFGDALPVDQGETGLPMPLNWHLYKGESARLHDQLLADRL